DAAGRLAETIAYAGATSAALRSSGTLDQLRPATAAADIRSYVFYNARGQVAAKLDGEGSLTELVYDLAGNTEKTVRYATRVIYAPGATLASLRPSSSAEDQVCDYVHDALNRVTSERNPDGLTTTYAYDEVGNVVSTTRTAPSGEKRTLTARYD